MKTFTRFVLGIILLLSFSASMWMDEGMWLLDTIHRLPLSDMKKSGLELTPEQLYSTTGTSVKDAIVLLPGGTGAYVSAEGLILTNHHIAFAGIQALSSVQEDYLKNGFVARTREEELSTSYTAQTVVSMKDVTAEVLSVVNDTMSADERSKAIQAKSREIEKREKGNTEYTCSVNDMYNGNTFYLFVYEQLNDVRLVYAPPQSIGNYGGEVDNWMWPRHTGDFAFMRAYVGKDGKPAKYSKDNVPHKPRVFLPFSIRGFNEGSFAMIMGFPGRTFRYRELSSLKLTHDQTLPVNIAFFNLRMGIIERHGKADRNVEIKYATKLRRMANAYKNYLGVLEGMRRADFLSVKQKEEEQFTAYLAANPKQHSTYGTLLAEMAQASDELKSFNVKNILFTNITGGLDLLTIANRFMSYAGNPPKDSLGKALPYTEKERAPVRETISSTLKNFDLNVEKETFVALVLKNATLPPDQQSTTFREIIGKESGAKLEKKVREFVDDLYDETALASQAKAEKLLLEDVDNINDDEFVQFARKIAAEQSALQSKVNAFNAKIGALRRKYVQALLEWKNLPVSYPDANRTLRMTYGEVESLNPRDAVHYHFATTLGGVMEKETNEEPFVVPPKLKELWMKKDFGRYADPTLRDVPVAFLANLDITGGNSGSPIMNGRGEIIGCAFDGNWEAVVGDYHFQPELNRCISVDSRYILFVLDKFSGAENLLKELVIK